MMSLIYANHGFADIGRSEESGQKIVLTSLWLFATFIFSSNVAEFQFKNTEKQDYLLFLILHLSYVIHVGKKNKFLFENKQPNKPSSMNQVIKVLLLAWNYFFLVPD